MNQISLIHKKILHLEETLKLEDMEGQLKQKIDFHHRQSIQEAEIVARKKDENAAAQQQLLLEEGERRTAIKKMMNQSDSSLAPVKEVLVNLEGTQPYLP